MTDSTDNPTGATAPDPDFDAPLDPAAEVAGGLEAEADLVDGGTGGFHLLGFFSDRPWIVLIDAAADGRPPGTVSLIRPRFASDFPRTLSAHDIGLKDLLRMGGRRCEDEGGGDGERAFDAKDAEASGLGG